MGCSFGGGGRRLSKWEEGQERGGGPSPGVLGLPERAGCLTQSTGRACSVSRSLPGLPDDPEPAFRLGEAVQCVCQRRDGRSSKFASCFSVVI